MPILVQCSCGVKLEIADRRAGTKVRCPKCSQPVDVPEPDLDNDEKPVQIQGERIRDNSKRPGNPQSPSGPVTPNVPMANQGGQPTNPSGPFVNQGGYEQGSNQTGFDQQAFEHQPFDQQPMAPQSQPGQPFHQDPYGEPSPYMMQAPMQPTGGASPFGYQNPVSTSSNNPFQAPSTSQRYINPDGGIPGQVIAVGVVGTILGLLHFVCGGFGLLGGLLFQSVALGFTGDEQAGPIASMISAAVWFMILMMLGIIIYGVCTATGSIGLFFKRKWAWVMSVSCGGLAAIAALFCLFSYVMEVMEVSQSSIDYDMDDSFERSMYDSEVRGTHFGGLLSTLSYMTYAILSLWFLLTPRIRRVFFRQ